MQRKISDQNYKDELEDDATDFIMKLAEKGLQNLKKDKLNNEEDIRQMIIKFDSIKLGISPKKVETDKRSTPRGATYAKL